MRRGVRPSRGCGTAGAQLPLRAVDLEDAAALEDQEDLMAQVVTVPGGDLGRLHAQEAGAYLRGHQQVADVRAVAEDREAHKLLLPAGEAPAAARRAAT